MAKQDADRYTKQRAANAALGTVPKVVLTPSQYEYEGAITASGTFNAKNVLSVQCDVDSVYSATYIDGTSLPSQTRIQNSVRGGLFSSVVCTGGVLILHLDPKQEL